MAQDSRFTGVFFRVSIALLEISVYNSSSRFPPMRARFPFLTVDSWSRICLVFSVPASMMVGASSVLQYR